MKTVISNILIILLLFSGISVKFATHYCGGHVAATKVSLTGELATCGMERQSDDKSLETTYSRSCCDDVTSSYSISSKYVTTSYCFSVQKQQVIDMVLVSPYYINSQETLPLLYNNSIRPPGIYYPNSVPRTALCIYQI
jgi:hypothetical protein